MMWLRCLQVAALVASIPGCSGPIATPKRGGVLHLEWRPIEVPAGAEDLRYECTVHVAEQGLPRRLVLFRTGLRETRLVSPWVPAAVYVFAVRARYRRNGQEWITRWGGRSASNVAQVPQRGFRPVVPRE